MQKNEGQSFELRATIYRSEGVLYVSVQNPVDRKVEVHVTIGFSKRLITGSQTLIKKELASGTEWQPLASLRVNLLADGPGIKEEWKKSLRVSVVAHDDSVGKGTLDIPMDQVNQVP